MTHAIDKDYRVLSTGAEVAQTGLQWFRAVSVVEV